MYGIARSLTQILRTRLESWKIFYSSHYSENKLALQFFAFSLPFFLRVKKARSFCSEVGHKFLQMLVLHATLRVKQNDKIWQWGPFSPPVFSVFFKNNPIFFWFGHTCLSANLHGLRRNICYTLNLVGNKTKWNTSANPMWINPACEKGETEYYSSSASGGQSKLNLEMRQGSVSGVKIAVFQDL